MELFTGLRLKVKEVRQKSISSSYFIQYISLGIGYKYFSVTSRTWYSILDNAYLKNKHCTGQCLFKK